MVLFNNWIAEANYPLTPGTMVIHKTLAQTCVSLRGLLLFLGEICLSEIIQKFIDALNSETRLALESYKILA